MATNFKRSYDNFEPFCQWQRGHERDILEVHLQGFKKEKLRVQINNFGVLIISGEQPTDDINAKVRRFRKEIKISKDLSADRIRAKFVNGVLYITLRHENMDSLRDKESKKQNSNNKVNNNSCGEMRCVNDGILRIEVSKRLAATIGVLVAVGIVAGGFLIAWKCSKIPDPLMY